MVSNIAWSYVKLSKYLKKRTSVSNNKTNTLNTSTWNVLILEWNNLNYIFIENWVICDTNAERYLNMLQEEIWPIIDTRENIEDSTWIIDNSIKRQIFVYTV